MSPFIFLNRTTGFAIYFEASVAGEEPICPSFEEAFITQVNTLLEASTTITARAHMVCVAIFQLPGNT